MPKLTYIGHSAFVLEDEDGHVVAIDPFITGNPVATIPASEVKPTTILVTHAHNDHVGDAMELAREHGAGIITTVELADWMESQGVANVTGANHGGTVAFPHGTVKLTQAWHSSSYWDGEKKVAHGIPAGMIVRFGGTTFYFVNDGPEHALALARESAGSRDVRIAGGADAIQQYLNLGVVEELEIALGAVLFGEGRRLFENLHEPLPHFRIDRVFAGSGATHIRYVRA